MPHTGYGLFDPAGTQYKFCGRVTKIYFEDESTDFYIFQAEDLETGKKRKCKGHFFSPRIRPNICFAVSDAEWEKHPKYGSTYVVRRASPYRDSPEDRAEWIRNSCPSLGRINANKIVQAFDQAGITVQDGMADLTLLEGFDFLTPSKAQTAYYEWRSHTSYADAANFLIGLGLPSGAVKSVYEALGEDTKEIVQDNPYALAHSEKVSFPQADKIAMNMGFTHDSKMRIASILEYLLDVASSRQGHLYLQKSKLHRSLHALPKRQKIASFGRQLSDQDVAEALKDRVAKGRVVVDGDKVYLKKNFDVEEGSASLLGTFSGQVALGVDMGLFLQDYERIYGITFSDEQAEAVRSLNDTKVLLLTGLPGTGKSTVTKAIVRLFEKAGKTFTLMAPTGIAAKRLSRVVGAQAGTIHRTLGFNGSSWAYGENDKFVTDAVIVDECCLPYKQSVMLADGTREYIGTIVHQKKEVEVLSYNKTTGEVEPKKVVNWFKYPRNEKNPLLKIRVSETTSRSRQRVLRCTLNHKVYLPDGSQKPAGELCVGDEVRVRGVFLNDIQRAFLLGSLLGDSCISQRGNSYSVRFTQGEDQEDYLLWKKDLYQCGEVQSNSSGYSKDRTVFSTSAHSIEDLSSLYAMFYTEKSKVVSDEVLSELNEISLAAWYMDDGSLTRCGDGHSCLLHTEGFSYEDNLKIGIT